MDVSHIKFTYFWQDYFTDTDNKIRGRGGNGNVICQCIRGHIKDLLLKHVPTVLYLIIIIIFTVV